MKKGFTLQNFSKKNLGGFTIIEFLIYIAILAIAIAGMGLILSNIFRVGVKTDIVQEVSHNGRFAIQRIGQAVRESSGIIEPQTEGNSLKLSFEDSTKNPTVFDVSSEGKLIIKEGEGEYYKEIELTTSRVVIDKLVFKKVSENSVKVEMNISFDNPQGLPEYEFNNFFTSSFTLAHR